MLKYLSMVIAKDPSKKSTVLPVLRERAVYVRDDGTGKDNSDYINKSFKGILRLSPNDSSTYLEKENYITYDDITDDYISFEDSVTNQLSKQFIKVSTSDGYLLDLRISNAGLEYNNLYVLGALTVNNEGPSCGALQLYAKDNKSFALGKSFIVSDYNKSSINTAEQPESMRGFTPITDKTINDAYILLSKANGGGMEFVNARNIVEMFIKSALMNLNSVPTGSIHAIPVSIYQYEQLLKKSVEGGGGHNITSENNDPLIRDYLICDGSYYKVNDFPELAKILYKEKIIYWKNKASYDAVENSQVIQYIEAKEDKKKDADGRYSNENTNNISEITIVVDPTLPSDDPDRTETVKVFRVPDLRGMFMQSVVPGLKNADKNVTGTFLMDNIKDSELTIAKGTDRHYHYIVLDSPAIKQKNTTSGTFQEICDDVEGVEYCKLKTNSPAALARYGALEANKFNKTTYRLPGNCGSCCTRCSWDSKNKLRGVSAIYKPTIKQRNCIVGGPSGGYILSTIPKSKDGNIDVSKWRGVSSWTIDMSVETDDLSENIDVDLNYTAISNDPIYNNKHADYVSYDSWDGDYKIKDMVGYENSPEFYAILPLIKI